jgi:hypothetical protein
LASSEESGKDWSDLEREAAEADKERSDFQDEYAGSGQKAKVKRPASYGGRKDSNQDRLAISVIFRNSIMVFVTHEQVLKKIVN